MCSANVSAGIFRRNCSALAMVAQDPSLRVCLRLVVVLTRNLLAELQRV
jgi:hypothetical protein